MFYAYLLEHEKLQGVVSTWEECQNIVKGKKAKFKKFKTMEEAKNWLNSGANYEKKSSTFDLDKEGIYFDAGTGRGIGVEVRVTNYKKESLLHKIIDKNLINEFGNITLEDKTNNYGELLGLYCALKYAIKYNIRNIYGDSELIIKYWSKGHYKKTLNDDTIKLINRVLSLMTSFNLQNGNLIKISGDNNPADLGFHR